ncbi:unnamed protein product [Schistosoma mattheei]|uniref:Uncharacterized protein n=1 Tax=Schistosoma mattheei TaxID=31246 RepID=A0A183PKW0_9TREM|nr:unnamed protein product [Schistosoma mattheei]
MYKYFQSDWRPQSYISQIAGTGHVFTAPLILGQGLIGEIHRSIVLKLSKTIENRAIAQNDTVPLSEINSPRYLIKLLELVFDALFMQARACLLVLRTLNGAKQVYCILLTHLNNISPSELNELSLSSNKNGLLKLQARTGRNSFVSGGDITPGSDNSSASLNLSKVDLNALMGRLPGVETQSGQNLTEKSAPIYPLACRPSGDNILSVYKMVMEFIEAVEWEMIKYTEFSDLHSVSSTHSNTSDDYRQQCQLRTLLKTFIETIYLPGKLSSLRNKLQKSLNSPDVLTSVVSQQTERELNLNRPILLVSTFSFYSRLVSLYFFRS